METFIPWTLVKRGIRRDIITPLDAPQAFTVEAAAERTKRKAAQGTPLIRALGLAPYWQRLLDEGKFRSITDIAAAEGIDVTQAWRLLRLTLLAQTVVDNLLANPDVVVNLESVLRRVMPLDWREQERCLRGSSQRQRVRNSAVTAGATIVAGCFRSRWLLKLRIRHQHGRLSTFFAGAAQFKGG